MTGLAENGPGGVAERMDPDERATRNVQVAGVDVPDVWFWHPAETPARFTVCAFVMDDDALPGAGRYALAVFAGGRESVSMVEALGLPAETGLSVCGIIRYPDTITTDDGARRVLRGMMRAAAAGDIPADPTPRAAGMAWTVHMGRLCEPFGGMLVMHVEPAETPEE